MHYGKVAVITRTKNRNILLKRAIESVINQEFQDWIMVIVNDGGEQSAVDQLVQQYESKANNRIVTIHHSTSKGMEAASNAGISYVDSKYIVIHDDDDSWHPLFLKKCVDFLDNNLYPNTYGVITHSTRILENIDQKTVTIHHKEPYNVWLRSITIYRMAADNVFPPISFVYHRSVINEIGLYREDLPVLGDWEFNLRFIEKHNIHVIHEELAYYHHRLEITNGDYSNSVIGGDSKHKYYDTIVRNDFLRKDLNAGKQGLGFLINTSKSFEIVHSQISPIESFISNIKSNRFLRILFRRN
ncbi:glycosyltransferase family 2 protein [Cohnella nanjingensis]|uniref:Glycosyltransferase family 2 protein n=1 Tax=Cohnella nanjingensis TaxID=1387779 RepID=A0A7X0RQH2_9BACL|nr:glycosyltransferase family 2 protein [Cohnella nanjingensis]MBB6670621.1 glycosyltransferase family 2 protein [Cohnella nanjingensis]